MSIESIYKILKETHNIERDELETLGLTTEEQVMDFFRNLSGSLSEEDLEEDNGFDKTPVDDYKLPEHRKKDLEGFKSKNVKFKNTSADLSHLPPDERVSEEGIRAEMAKLKKAMRIKLPSSNKNNP